MSVIAAPFDGIYQIGYVTNDLDRAVAELRELHNIGEFAFFKDTQADTINGRKALIDIAFAYVGAIELELIHPRSGHTDVWDTALPKSGYSLRHHHFCWYCQDEKEYDATRARMIAKHGPLWLDAEGPFGRVFYADTRAVTGHFMEAIYPSEMMKEMKKMIPHY